jgi:hypothetical protein
MLEEKANVGLSQWPRGRSSVEARRTLIRARVRAAEAIFLGAGTLAALGEKGASDGSCWMANQLEVWPKYSPVAARSTAGKIN